MTSAVPTTAPEPSVLERLRRRHRWINHLIRTATQYAERHGDLGLGLVLAVALAVVVLGDFPPE